MRKKVMNLIFALCIVLFFYNFLNLALHGFRSEKTTFFGFKNVYIMSDSMEPTIMTHAICLTKNIEFDSVKEGDIITYWHENKMIIHRVLEKHSEYLIMQGDNNDIPDPWEVYPKDIKGKVIYIGNWFSKL